MSEDTDKICRSVLYVAKTAKNLEGAIRALEVICGAENTAYVNDKLMEAEGRKND